MCFSPESDRLHSGCCCLVSASHTVFLTSTVVGAGDGWGGGEGGLGFAGPSRSCLGTERSVRPQCGVLVSLKSKKRLPKLIRKLMIIPYSFGTKSFMEFGRQIFSQHPQEPNKRHMELWSLFPSTHHTPSPTTTEGCVTQAGPIPLFHLPGQEPSPKLEQPQPPALPPRNFYVGAFQVHRATIQ